MGAACEWKVRVKALKSRTYSKLHKLVIITKGINLRSLPLHIKRLLTSQIPGNITHFLGEKKKLNREKYRERLISIYNSHEKNFTLQEKTLSLTWNLHSLIGTQMPPIYGINQARRKEELIVGALKL